jgi:hypothetical protein
VQIALAQRLNNKYLVGGASTCVDPFDGTRTKTYDQLLTCLVTIDHHRTAFQVEGGVIRAAISGSYGGVIAHHTYESV